MEQEVCWNVALHMPHNIYLNMEPERLNTISDITYRRNLGDIQISALSRGRFHAVNQFIFPALYISHSSTMILSNNLFSTSELHHNKVSQRYLYRSGSLHSTVQGRLAWPGTGWHWILSASNLDCIQTGPQSQPRTQNRSACHTEALVLSCTGCHWCEAQLQQKHDHK